MIRIGAAAAPRWWGVDARRLPSYLAHLSGSGATSVELVVHHGPATRDHLTVHLDQRDWSLAIDEAARVGLHIDVHNSLDPRFRLGRWSTDARGLQADLMPVLELVCEIERRQDHPPALVVHAAEGCPDAEVVTSQVLGWMASELNHRHCRAAICVELRAKRGPDDERFDRNRERLAAFLAGQRLSTVGMCWDVANEWLSARRSGRELEAPLAVPSCLRHVHLHDATADGLLHAPLGEGNVPWADALTRLGGWGWDGSVTLEIRYRLAHEVGDPWTVLAESIRRAKRMRK